MDSFAQKATPLPHGMVFGIKPSVVAPVPATQLESLMEGKPVLIQPYQAEL